MSMKRFYRYFILCVLCALAASCTQVRFNQKALLGDDMMLFDADGLGADLQNHVLTPREGSVGGFSSVGAGGCGCN